MSNWIIINLPWDEYGFNENREFIKNEDCFCGRGLNNSGTLIRLKNGKEYLIGDINESGGVCDDCKEFSWDTIILAYKVVWKPND